jgi:hypothetical protein
MHKSGTTLLANILHSSGIHMIDAEAEGADYDRGGHFERRAANRINKELLQCGGAHSLDVIRVPSPEEWEENLRLRAAALGAQLDREHRHWGFKDPRTCLTYPFWREVLGRHRIIFVYRDPREVVSHYLTRSARSGIKSKVATATKALRAWHVYNDRVLEFLPRRGQPWITLDYSAFMRDDRFFASDSRLHARYRSRRPNRLVYRLAKTRVKHAYGFDVDALYLSLGGLSGRGRSE